jgi:osmoprotectant transport system permease protein
MSVFWMELMDWFAQPGRWMGSDGIVPRTVEHLWLAVLATVLAVVLALPIALWLAHLRKGEFVANATVNVGRAIPSFGLLILVFVVFARVGLDLRTWPIVVALVSLAMPPIFTNAYTGIVTVPPETVEAARGMGLTERQILGRIELPVGAPVVLAGIRISFIQVMATVPLGAVVSSGGGLGQYVVRGFAQGAGGRAEVFAGAVLIALLTVGAEWAFARAERLFLPAGVQHISVDQVRAAASVS